MREAVRERYLSQRDRQIKAMEAFIGIRKEGPDAIDAVEYVQNLRRGTRLDSLYKKR